jgi:hypothetical protein
MTRVPKAVFLAVLAVAVSPAVCFGDSGLFWLYQFAGGTASIPFGQTALAMGGSKSWPVVFAPSAANPFLTQTLALGAFRNPATNTYWTNRGPIPLAFGANPILSAKSTSLGQIGFSMNSGSGTSAAYIGTRDSGLTEITNGAFGLAVNSKQQLVAATASWLAGSVIPVVAVRGVALDPWDNLGLTVADSPSSSLSYYEKNGQSGWQSAPLGYTTMSNVNYYADIAYDGSGAPVISYTSANAVYAANFDIRSGQWQSVSLGAGSLAGATLPVYPTIATDSKGGVGVSWVASTGSSTLMYAYKARDAAWKVYPVTSSVSAPLFYGGGLATEPLRPQARVGLDFDANDLPVISFMGNSGRVYIAYDPVLTPTNVPEMIRAVSEGQQQVDSTFVTGAVRLVKQGQGTLVREGAANNMFGTLVEAGTLVVNGVNAIASGTVTVMPNATIRLQVGDMSANSLDIQAGAVLDVGVDGTAAIGDMSLASGGKVDVRQALITTVFGDASAADILQDLQSGRGDGSWNGSSGITSSAAATSSGSRSVGWLDNGDGSVTFGYAASGDSNLDWTIDILDVANFIGSGKFNSGLAATWADGDFNYDGFADILDIADFMSSGLFNAGPYNAPSGTIAAVPEPSTYAMALAGIACGGYLRFRRRKQA